jgi:hypothetical protein
LCRTVWISFPKYNSKELSFPHLPFQQRELTNSIRKLEEELLEIKGLLEEKREQLKKSKEQEKALEEEIEALRQEAKRKEKMVRDRERIWDDQTVHAGWGRRGVGGKRVPASQPGSSEFSRGSREGEQSGEEAGALWSHRAEKGRGEKGFRINLSGGMGWASLFNGGAGEGTFEKAG